MAPPLKEQLLNFDIDHYLNRVVPKSRLHLLPKPISHFLGHREHPQKKIYNVVAWAWALIGGFAGVALIEGVFRQSSLIQKHDPPVIIGSFGAAAILLYNTIESPLSQPRNLVGGQVIAAIVGVGITKLFELESAARFQDHQWLAGALAVGISSALMSITKTVHPPAGATALLAATSPEITRLSWYYVALVALASALMLGSALVLNNIQRQFPIYWWTPADISRESRTKSQAKTDTTDDEEKKLPKRVDSDSSSEEMDGISHSDESFIVISHDRIVVPEWLELDDWQRQILQEFRTHLQGS